MLDQILNCTLQILEISDNPFGSLLHRKPQDQLLKRSRVNLKQPQEPDLKGCSRDDETEPSVCAERAAPPLQRAACTWGFSQLCFTELSSKPRGRQKQKQGRDFACSSVM